MRSITSSTWAWIVTSSAVVGSSAMSTSGSLAIDMAIMARWRMPPEYSCGYWSMRRSALGMPTNSSSSITRLRSARRSSSSWWHGDGLGDLIADPQDRVQRGQRILEHHGDALAPQRPQLRAPPPPRQPHQLLPPRELHAALVYLRGVGGQQAEDRHRGDALARPRLPHDAQGLVLVDVDRLRWRRLACTVPSSDEKSTHRSQHLQRTGPCHGPDSGFGLELDGGAGGRGLRDLQPARTDPPERQHISAWPAGRTRRAGRHPGSSRTAR